MLIDVTRDFAAQKLCSVDFTETEKVLCDNRSRTILNTNEEAVGLPGERSEFREVPIASPIMQKAKIEGPMSLVTLALLSGAEARSVSRTAGHATVAFTLDTYQHVLPALRKDATDRIGALLFGSVPGWNSM